MVARFCIFVDFLLVLLLLGFTLFTDLALLVLVVCNALHFNALICAQRVKDSVKCVSSKLLK